MIYLRIPSNGYTAIGFTMEKLGTNTFFDGSKFVPPAADGSCPPPINVPQGKDIYASAFVMDINTDNVSDFTDGPYGIFLHKMDSKAVVGYDELDYEAMKSFTIFGRFASGQAVR